MTEKLLIKNRLATIVALFIALFVLPNVANAQEAYAVEDGNGTLTFYYDTHRGSRTGTIFDIADGSGEPAWASGNINSQNKTTKKAVFDKSFRDYRPTTLFMWFGYCTKLTSLEGLENFNTSEVTNMSGMFFFCTSLTSLDLSTFNTSKVKDMSTMFLGCSNLKNIDVSSFNTSNVWTMTGMFRQCSSLTTIDISNFTANNINTNLMFLDCSKLQTIYCNDTWQCNLSTSMFKGCEALKGAVAYNSSKIDGAMANPDTGYFTRIGNIPEGLQPYVVSTGTTITFYYDENARSRTGKVYVIDSEYNSAPEWTTKNVTTAVFDASFSNYSPTSTAYWFHNLVTLTTIEGIENLKTESVTNMRNMFYGCYGLTNLDLSGFVTANVSDMRDMFLDCSKLGNINLSNFNTAKVTNMSSMFAGCQSLTSLDVSNFNTENVTNMSGMFKGCKSLTSLDVTKFNTAKATDMSGMFNGCQSLTSLNVSNFNTEKVTNMSSMFFNCNALTSLDVSKFNTTNVTDMSGMFYGCSLLTSLDVLSFNTTNVTDMCYMFYGCSKLVVLNLVNFNTKIVNDLSSMFEGCKLLKTIYCNDDWVCPVSTNMFYDCILLVGAAEYYERKVDVAMANPETGYFTMYYDPWPYAKVNGGVITFYFDNLPDTHTGTTYNLPEAGKAESWIGSSNELVTKAVFDASFADCRLTNTAYLFYNFNVLKTIVGINNLNTENVTDMTGMFYNCNTLSSLNLSFFNTEKVASMSSMFSGCESLSNLDVSKLNTGKVINMRDMFSGCISLTTLNLSNFVTNNVINMRLMFNGCSALTTIYCNDTWTCSSSTDMFNGCTSLKGAVSFDATKTDVTMANPETGYFTKTGSTPPPLEKEAYAVEDGTTLTFYYDDQRAIRTGTVYDIGETKSNETVTKAVFDASFKNYLPTSLDNWFYRCSKLQTIDGIENLNTANVTDMNHMFCYCSALTSLDLSNFNTANVTDMSNMFNSCSALTSIDVSNFNTDKVTDISNMFQNCRSLTSLDVSNFNTANVKKMGFMFWGCSKLTSLDVSNFDTSNVTNMLGIFYNCSSLTSVDVSRFNTANVTIMDGMFNGCRALTSIDVSNFNTGKVTDIHNMFQNCSSLTSLNVSNFNTANVTNMSNMFYGCSELTTIVCDDTWTCSASTNMFSGCTVLKGAVAYDASKTDVTMANPETGYFTKTGASSISEINVDSNRVKGIYNMMGVKMQGDINTLPAGIYIVDGKKVIVK